LKAIREILVDRGDSIVWSKIETGNSYYVGVDMAAAMKKPGSDKDIPLREGDRIFVPEYNGIVKVSGTVMFPNTVSFVGGGCSKYIDQAGGYASRAKRSKTFIVYQNGTVGLVSKGAKPEPGCEIIVPAKKRKVHSDFNVAAFATTMSAVATLGTSIVAIVSLVKTSK